MRATLSARSLEEAALRPPTVVIRALIVGFAGLGLAALVWAAACEIDIRARGSGQIVTASQTQVVQNLEGGIVTDIKVRNGDVVQPGQILVQLSPMGLQADLKDREATAAGLQAAVIRLEAESRGTSPVFPERLRRQAPEVVRGEAALHLQRKEALASQLDVLESELSEKRAVLAELRARVPSIRETQGMIQEQLREIQALVAANAASPAELFAYRKEAMTQRIQLSVAQESIPGAEAAVAGAQRRLREKRATFAAVAMEQLGENRVKLLALQGVLEARQDQVTRTAVLSPVRGVVKTLHVSTRGEVVAPGRTIAEIVPVGDHLQVEARISPTDIGFVAPGQPVDVRLTAFDHAIYGSLAGQVDQISPDTVRDEQDPRMIFYRVRVHIEKNHLTGPTGELAILPGMIAEVDIQTGRRTVLDYFLKPLTRVQDTALRER